MILSHNDSLRNVLYKTQEIISHGAEKASSAILYPIWETKLMQTDWSV